MTVRAAQRLSTKRAGGLRAKDPGFVDQRSASRQTPTHRRATAATGSARDRRQAVPSASGPAMRGGPSMTTWSASRASSGASRCSVSRARPKTPNRRGMPSLARCCGPVERRALRIGVDQTMTRLPFPGPFAGEMQGECRLADATFLVEERHDHRALLRRIFHRSRRSPTTEELDSCRLDSKLGSSEAIDWLG